MLMYTTYARRKAFCKRNWVIFQLYRAGVNPAGEGSGAPAEWIPVELEILTKLWLPDTEILRLKGFHRLSVLDRLQVRQPSSTLTSFL